MIKSLAFAALLTAGLATHAMAVEQAPAAGNEQLAQLNATADAQAVRQILTGQGYTNISVLDRDERGRWIGTAIKDGKTTGVAIALPRKQ